MTLDFFSRPAITVHHRHPEHLHECLSLCLVYICRNKCHRMMRKLYTTELKVIWGALLPQWGPPKDWTLFERLPYSLSLRGNITFRAELINMVWFSAHLWIINLHPKHLNPLCENLLQPESSIPDWLRADRTSRGCCRLAWWKSWPRAGTANPPSAPCR